MSGHGGIPGMGMGMGGMFGGDDSGDAFGSRTSRSRAAAAQRKAAPIQHDLNVSLEDLFTGSTKRVRITKKVTDASGRTTQVAATKEISIKPGWKDGTKITYEREGDEAPGVIPADIIFVIKGSPHPVFTRDGDDLNAIVDVSLEDAMRGVNTSIKTLDNRTLPIREKSVTPQTVKVFHGEGMMNNKVSFRCLRSLPFLTLALLPVEAKRGFDYSVQYYIPRLNTRR